MLRAQGVDFTYREYTEDPLSADEIRAILARLGQGPHDLLRTRDARKLGLDASALDAEALIAAMAEHPTLLQRPIALCGERAAVGRPPEQILEILP